MAAALDRMMFNGIGDRIVKNFTGWNITSDPEWDASNYCHATTDNRPYIGDCVRCGCELRGGDVVDIFGTRRSAYEADRCYLLPDGSLLCGSCLYGWIDEQPYRDDEVKIFDEWMDYLVADDYINAHYRV